MRITADHAFHIGSQHLRSGMPCQDYALSEVDGHVGYGVLSDGCSTGRRTDVGARIITHNTALALNSISGFAADKIDSVCVERDRIAKSSLGLRLDDMLATCAYIAVNTEKDFGAERAKLRVIGDGVIAFTTTYDTLTAVRFEWLKNMPFYRAYHGESFYRFWYAHGADGTGHAANAHTFTRGSGLDDRNCETKITLEDAIAGFELSQFTLRDRQSFAVFSDGVTQVDGMDWRDVVAELMAFKSTEGEFVKRRMNRFLRDCLRHGKGPVDDISMACIHIDHEAE